MGQSKALRVLVIDDDPDFLDYVSIVLQSAGYRVSTATSAQRGLGAMASDLPDMVIADVMLSLSLDGLLIDHEMAQDPCLREIPLLMVSAIVTETDPLAQKRPETHRFAGFMRKPIEPGALLRRVAEIASGKP